MKPLDQLEDNLGAVGWTLTEDEMERSLSLWNTNNVALNVQDVYISFIFFEIKF